MTIRSGKEMTMPTPLVLTFVGRDRPGLVNAISERVTAAGGTWLESRLARLAGEFAGIVLVAAPPERIEALTKALHELETAGLRVAVAASLAPEAPRNARLCALAIVGHERPGIVRNVTQTLTKLGINIEEFSSGVEAAPFTGAEMFRAEARLRLPDGLALDELRKTLERLAGEIMVDLTIGEGGDA
jgi:glycine cleavage system regulatory protein